MYYIPAGFPPFEVQFRYKNKYLDDEHQYGKQITITEIINLEDVESDGEKRRYYHHVKCMKAWERSWHDYVGQNVWGNPFIWDDYVRLPTALPECTWYTDSRQVEILSDCGKYWTKFYDLVDCDKREEYDEMFRQEELNLYQ